jgi:drug/metabolite transporter (DMT)-like permease
VIDQNFYYAGLKFTGPTFACAMSNILPAMTFVLAVIFRCAMHAMRFSSDPPTRTKRVD